MMVYYLLRNNKESGPYTLKELKEAPLFTTDLIWINGESTSWQSPADIAEIAGLAKEPVAPPRSPRPSTPADAQSMAAPAPAGEEAFYTSPATNAKSASAAPLSEPSFEALKEKYATKGPRKKVWKTQVNIGANLMGIAILLIGISLAAFMLKKAVDNIEPEPIAATAEARELGSTAAYVSSSNQAAKASLPAVTRDKETSARVPEKPATETVEKTAPVATEIMAPETPEKNESAPVARKEEKKEVAGKQIVAKTKREEDTAGEDKSLTKEKAGEEMGDSETNKNETTAGEKKINKPRLQLSANEYKVGFLGGISNLELSVNNPSAEGIRHAVVEVEYLKPNGKVVGTQQVEVSNLAPHATKKISVPDNGRGVTVRYRVVNTEFK